MPFTGIEESKVGTNKGTQDGPAKNGYRVAPDQFTDERVLARFENGDDVSLHEVEILLAEFVRLVLDLAGVVANDESSFAFLRHFVVVVFLVD